MTGPGLPAYACDDDALLAQCQVERMRSGGPGGQHANRSSSAVRLTHQSGISAACSDHREQPANLKSALRVLRLRLACAQRGISDPAWLDGLVHGGRIGVTPASPRYVLAVAVLLDALHRCEGRLAEAATACGLSSSQLVKALCASSDARAAADQVRAAHGHGAIKAR